MFFDFIMYDESNVSLSCCLLSPGAALCCWESSPTGAGLVLLVVSLLLGLL